MKHTQLFSPTISFVLYQVVSRYFHPPKYRTDRTEIAHSHMEPHLTFDLPLQPTDMQPGLTLLLEGQVPASSSQFSIDKVLLAPTGSLRHSRHSSASRHSAIGSKRSSTTASEVSCVFTASRKKPQNVKEA